MTTARPILGRGLDALIARSHDRRDEPAPQRVAIDQIDPNPEQPRGGVDPAALQELAASVRSIGVLQPLLVTAGAGGRFTLVAGERRWRAARLAGLREVPVVVTSLAGDELLTAALVENVQREDLSPLEEAGAYARLLAASGESQGAHRGARRQEPQRRRQLPATAGPARPHPRQPRPRRDQRGPRARPARRRRPRRARGAVAARRRRGPQRASDGARGPCPQRGRRRATPDPGAPSRDPDADAALIADLERALGTRVRLHRGGRGGRLEIRWYDDEQLQHLAGRLAAPAADALPPPPAHLTI